jgi:PAS domain S-box-containing protein
MAIKHRGPKGTKGEQRVRLLLEQTASARGDELLGALARGLAQALGTRFGGIGALRGDNELECLAFWDGSQLARGMRFPLEGTPEALLMREEYCVYRDGAADAFPENQLFRQCGVRGFMGAVIRDADRRPLGAICLMHDAPLPASAQDRALLEIGAARVASEMAQMQLAAELEASGALTRGILESMRDAILVVRPDGGVAFHNGAACELFRTDPATLTRASLADLLPELERAATELGDGDPAESYRRRVSLELEARTLAGESVQVGVTVGAFESAGQSLRTVSIRNIERRRREEQRLRGYARALERANADLERARRKAERAAAAKTEFLANMSHEIRTPMTAILGFTDILLEGETALTHDQSDALRTIRRNGAYLLEILNDILDFSKIEANRLEIEQVPCSPRGIASDAIELLLPRAEAKQVALRLELDTEMPERVVSDPVRLRQVLLNLIGNAVKFTSVGHVRVVLRYEAAERMLEFEVEDTGIGIDPSVLAHIFEPFQQADSSMTRRFGGTGLGLAITKRLVERLGGAITAQSTVGRGSTFRVRVPAEVMAQTSGAEPEPDTPTTDRMRAALESLRAEGRVLLVEDGADNQRVIRHVLERAGYEVTIAENGLVGVELALAALEEGTPFSVILMDVQMPVLDGYGATRQLRDRGYTGPIVALTAHALPSEKQRCLEAGCDSFATKPIERVRLLQTIASFLTTKPGD